MSSRTNIFSGPHLDRQGHQRGDSEWLHQQFQSDETRFVPVWRSRNLIAAGDNPAAVLLTRDEIGPKLPPPDRVVYLGRFREEPCFAFELTGEEESEQWPEGRFHDLRRIGHELPNDEASLLAYARGMVLWHRSHGHCGRCGAPSHSYEAGHVRQCTNPDCAHQTFPRVDPAIIALVTDGHRCLLGRQKDWPKGRYSAIAGFVEPGESLEDAVAREVMEETGVDVDCVGYYSSQPWPFPASLMLGFTARARSFDIDLKDGELEDARWFEPEDFASGGYRLPNPVSIACRLVESWLEQHSRPNKK